MKRVAVWAFYGVGALAIAYLARDEKGAVSQKPAIIVIDILPMPEKPDAVADTIAGTEDQATTFLLTDLLAENGTNDTKPLGDEVGPDAQPQELITGPDA